MCKWVRDWRVDVWSQEREREMLNANASTRRVKGIEWCIKRDKVFSIELILNQCSWDRSRTHIHAHTQRLAHMQLSSCKLNLKACEKQNQSNPSWVSEQVFSSGWQLIWMCVFLNMCVLKYVCVSACVIACEVGREINFSCQPAIPNMVTFHKQVRSE